MADKPILMSGPMVRATLREIEQPGTGKTQTRRSLDQGQFHRDCVEVCRYSEDDPTLVQRHGMDGSICGKVDVRYHAGDRLYVREAWRTETRAYDDLAPSDMGGEETVIFEADADWKLNKTAGRLRQGMHMPRWASRITLIVKNVRVQRLQEISEADAIAEGVIRQDPTPEDEEWNRQWAEDHGHDPDPMQPVWLAPGTRQGYGPRRDHPEWGPTPQFAFRLLWDSINGKRPGCAWSDNPWISAITFDPILANIDSLSPELDLTRMRELRNAD